jgi:hypothetical protein
MTTRFFHLSLAEIIFIFTIFISGHSLMSFPLGYFKGKMFVSSMYYGHTLALHLSCSHGSGWDHGTPLESILWLKEFCSNWPTYATYTNIWILNTVNSV